MNETTDTHGSTEEPNGGLRHRASFSQTGTTDSTSGAEGSNTQAPSTKNGSEDVRTIRVLRPVYSQSAFDTLYEHTMPEEKTVKDHVHHTWRKRCACSSECFKAFLLQLFPFVGIMRQYKFPLWLISDIVAGITVGIMNLPQGMAYALVSGLPSIHGLYASFFPPLVYFFFGSSRHISIASAAVASLLVGSFVDKQTANWTPSTPLLNNSTDNTSLENEMTCNVDTTDYQECVDFKINLVVALTLLAGCWQLLQGILRLGFITNYLSDPLVSGFTTGAACHVFSSQIKHVFGVSVKTVPSPFKLISFYIQFFPALPQTNLTALIMSAICILTLVLIKECINARFKSKMKVPIPAELLVVIGGTLVCYFVKLDEVYDLVVVGDIPTGIPHPSIPPAKYFGEVVLDSLVVAIVAFSINLSMAKILAKPHGYTIDANQELVAYGLSNVVGGFFTAFASGASMSRSCVQESAGGKTQVASIIASGFILIVILAAGPLFKTLPRCVLASIIIVALKGMFLQVKDLKRLWRISKFDFAIWIVTFLGVVILNVDYGLMIGVGFSLLTVVFRTQWPYTCLYGRVPHSDIYRDSNIYKAVEEIPGIKIFHFESSLYYANAEHFRSKLYAATGCDPGLLKAKQMKSKEKREALEKERQKEEKKRQKAEKRTGGGVSNGAMIGQSKEVLTLEIEDIRPDDKVATEGVVHGEPPPQPDIHHIIIDCSAITFIDAVGIKVLKQVLSEYKEVNIQVVLAHCRAQLSDMLHKNGFIEDHGRDVVCLMVHDAVLMALADDLDLLKKLEDDTLITSHSPEIEMAEESTNDMEDTRM
ncbi:solute carrier family 26 member 6-like [Lingula anatina]|uniref:Solute carrier family 26 member 6-like n=1 Tax=Lingula anatina TaxID=7574 RepID=A0A1S3JNB9_LINAN|nr:solute carrier family 26 member 6-like [Lingula anatina]XP_013411868.1 solute carrier family 26 member 6-like [Lingula anatina]XP_013411869.1 solute carrier family 26 member 6-like [Lingula anatina]|eukprot:XP_013411867.1 solute carrier family 26 member 6-like [Lingula anatina]